MASLMTLDSLTQAVLTGLGDHVSVRSRRPGRVFQVEIPAYLADGDSAILFVEPSKRGSGFLVSDLGHTVMRLSYTKDVTDHVLSELGELADRHGFSVLDDAIEATVSETELIGALFGLAQIESSAEDMLRKTQKYGPQPEEFRELVVEALRQEFRDLVQVNVPVGSSSDADFRVDAILKLRKTVAVEAVPNDLEAERAIGNRYRAKDSNEIQLWVAVPREMKKLNRRTQDRLVDAFVVSGSKYEPDSMRERLHQLVA